WDRGQRCILTMAGFYEPHKFQDGRKEPFYVHLVDREIFGVAGLWDRSVKPDGTEILSCSLITTPANEFMPQIHNAKLGMPAVLRPEGPEAWLQGPVRDARAVLTPYPPDLMVTWQVSRRLYANKGPNDAGLIEPVPEQPVLQELL